MNPPAAYAETPRGVVALETAPYSRWCLPLDAVPEESRAFWRVGPWCYSYPAPLPVIDRSDACLRRLLPAPEWVPQVAVRPGETVQVHTHPEAGAATMTIDGGPEVSNLSWAADAPGGATLAVATRSDLSDLRYGVRVVVARDIRPPAFRLNVRWRSRTVEVTLGRRSRLAVCFTPLGLDAGPAPVVAGWRDPGVVRIRFAGRFPRSVTVRADTPSGVTRVVTVMPPTG